MLSENRKVLIDLRLEQAHICLKEAELMLSANFYKGTSNRSYYCIFHSMRAVLAINKLDSKKHMGIISMFRERYIKTGIFDKTLSDIVGKAFTNRGESDYNDFFIISKEETLEQVNNAGIFLLSIEEYINKLEIEDTT